MGPGPAPPSLTSTDTGSHIVRAGHKRYFFDLGSNNKGQYLRITEVRPPKLDPFPQHVPPHPHRGPSSVPHNHDLLHTIPPGLQCIRSLCKAVLGLCSG